MFEKSEKIVDCFKQNITYLSKRGYKPVYNVIDNVATKEIKTYTESEKIEVQFVTQYDHRVNAAEQAIQTFKNHTISGLCICYDEFSSILWCKIIQWTRSVMFFLNHSTIVEWFKKKQNIFIKKGIQTALQCDRQCCNKSNKNIHEK